MNRREILIICLILCLICSISAVSAADVSEDSTNKTLTTSDDDVVRASDDLSLNSISDEDILGSGGGSFTELNGIINGDGSTVDLDKNYTYTTADSDFTGGIFFTKGITIDGHGYTIDGNNLARIFGIGTVKNQGQITHPGITGSVILKNIRFVNAGSDEGDQNSAFGAIEFTGVSATGNTLLIENCTFLNNKANGAAAIALGYSYNNEVSIKNCTFEGNTATSIGGGAIRLRNSVENLKINNTIFNNNHAGTDAGAIHMASSGSGTVIDNCTFMFNTADSNAGAVYSAVSNSNIKFKNTKFINNTATNNGGALWFVTDTTNDIIDNCTFINNSAKGNSDGHGGALYLQGSNGIVNNSYFAYNFADYDGIQVEWGGGAISLAGSTSNILINNCTFDYNRATKGGGAIVSRNSINLIINKSHFNNNHALGGGALLLQNPNEFKLLYSTFNKNVASKPNGDYESGSTKGGAIYFTGQDINNHILNCSFEENKAGRGGAIRCEGSNSNPRGTGFELFNSTFKNNYAHWEGAGFSSNYLSENNHFENCTFIGGTSSKWGSNGGGLYLNCRNSLFVNITVTDCTATQGGGMDIQSSQGSTFKDIKIIDCYATSNGGAVRIWGSNSVFGNVTISNSYLTNVNNGGGAIYWSGNTGTLTNVNISKSSSTNNGGAIYWIGSTGVAKNISINNSNALNGNGGAIYWVGSTGTLSDVNVTDSHSIYGGAVYWSGTGGTLTGINISDSTASNGGAIYWYGSSGTLTSVNVSGSSATDNGGAIYWEGSGASVDKVNITDSSAVNGGAIYWTGNTGTFNNVNISKSHAVNGGAVYVTGSGDTLSNAIINNTYATNNGGAVYWSGPSGNLENINITHTYAVNGGAIYYPGSGSLTSLNITNSNATDAGGAIYLGTSSVTVSKSVFSNNNATRGGVIYSSSFNGNVVLSNFTNNTANVGGAIYVASSNQNILNCTFEGNNATGNGGAIYLAKVSDVTIKDSTFKKSYAYNGGAIYNTGSAGASLYIINDTFIKNVASHNAGAVYYIVDNEGTRTNVIYRDYDNFDKRGQYDSTTHRTNVTMVSNDDATFENRILNSYFENNTDYVLNVSAASMALTVGGIINISNPNDVNNNSYRIVINITNGTSNVPLIILNTTQDYELYFNDVYKKFIINARNNLTKNTKYNVTVGFEDSEYLYKEAKVNFTTIDVEIRGDFRILQSLIEDAIENHSGILNLQRSYEFSYYLTFPEMDYPDYNYMNITRPVTINGNGFTINALGYSRIFNITADNVILNNINFINGNSSGEYNDGVNKGGAIFWAGKNGTVNSSTFRYNYAEYGGGIYFNSTAKNCNVTNDLFASNNATKNGGAIDCNASNMRLYNTTFESNRAENGSALCREVNATGGSGRNNTFISNHATNAGAALAWMKAENIYIDTYYFRDNTADFSGGAIYVGIGSTNCTVFNCTFIGNNVTSITHGHGGAIEWYADTGRVLNSTFRNNNAFTGGAIYVGSESSQSNSGHINITNSGFLGNNAISLGGAIDLVASSVTVNNSYFRENTAKYGGAIFAGGTGDNNHIYSAVFMNNSATVRGGAVDWNSTAGHINKTNFTGNSAQYGGAVYVGGASENSRIENVIFTSNKATKNGGAIDWNATGGQLYNTQFISNYAGEYGAALCRESGATGGSGKNNTFRYNHADIAGAALAWLNVTGIHINDYKFYYNTANASGAAIFIGNGSDNCGINGSVFVGNNVTNETGGHGGAIDVVANNASVTNSNFTNNNAFYGGAIFVGSASGNTNITNATFKDNTAVIDGGAINLQASGVTLNGTYFEWNVAQRNGGAVYVGGVGTTNKIYNSNFTSNVGYNNGGAIYWRAYAGHIEDSNFTLNSATNGGAIYLNGVSSNTNITHVIFDDNNALKNGGAIDCNSTKMNLTYTLFKNNYAGEYGAALCREKGATSGFGEYNNFTSNHAGIAGAALAWLGVENINIKHYIFTDNYADVSGGAIYADEGSSNYTIDLCVFKGNNVTGAKGQGGAIDSDSDNNTIKNSNFTNNHAYDGGAIHVGSDSGHTNITNATFTKNGAYHDGGAINLFASGVRLNDTRFYNNTATNNGGAVYVGGEGTTNVVFDSLFDKNEAGNRGGAIDWIAEKGEIKYTNFTRNSAKDGGALYLNGRSSGSELSHLIFDENIATKNGGAIDCNATLVNLTHTKFTSNTAEFGAALCREAGATGGFGVNNTFDKNHATKSGAALAWLGVGNIHINNYTFTNNTADYSGGAIYVGPGSDNCSVANCTFEDDYVSNAITGRGGAIDWIGNNGTVKNTTFTRCISVNGGGIYVDAKSDNMTVENVTFISCSSLTNGGAIAVYGDNITVTHTNFTSSHSKENGAAIAGFGSDNANISYCNFKYNLAAGYVDPNGVPHGDGGAIYWVNSKNLTVSNSTFNSNGAHMSGGAISADNCSDSLVYNITSHNETAATNGGSIAWINSNNVTIDLCFLDDPGADYMGGAIYLSKVNATVNNTILNSTWAAWDLAGGIYVDGNVTINNVTFNDTHAMDDNATAIYFASGISTLSNSNFTNSINSIGIAKGANVTLIKNNLTAGDPNKSLTYLLDNTTLGIEKTRYAVWNEGNLSLEKNSFDYVIINNGTITSKTYLDVLDNRTWNATWNETFTFFANITDDNLNTIISVNSLKTWNNHDMGGSFNMSYNQRVLNTYFQEEFIIYGSDSGLTNCVNRSGTIRVKMPTNIEFNKIDVEFSDNEVRITTYLKTPVQSNFTVDGQKLKFKIGDREINATLSATDKWIIATAVLSINNWTAGTHEITATYTGDNHHLGSVNTTSFEFKLRASWIKLYIENVTYGQTAYAVVTTNSNGTVRFNFHSKSGVVDVPMTKRADGNYTGTVEIPVGDYKTTGLHDAGLVLEENGYYEYHVNQTTFEVYKLNTTVGATPMAQIKVDEKEVITVIVSEDYAGRNATGFVNITIAGETYYKKLNSTGGVKFNIYEIPKGEYNNVNVSYEGDDYFNGNSTLISFTVGATSKYNMTVKVDNVTYGQNATIYIVLPISVSQNLTVYVNNTKYENVTVKDGLAIVNVNNTVLDTPGQYVVNVTYPGDDVYALKYNNGTTFHVTATDDWTLYLSVDAHAWGQDTTFTVTVPGNVATRLVNITIDGTYHPVTIDADGFGTLTLNNLSGGLHTVTANYTGDSRYVTKTNSTNFLVEKASSTTALTQNADGDVIATVTPTNVTGSVTFYVNGREYTVNLVGNVATLNKNNLTIGNNTIVALYNGDINFTSSKDSKNITIAKNDALVNVTATNETYGNASEITVKVPTDQKGYVTITVNDTLLNVTVKIENGEAKFNASGLGVGRYVVNVTYLGDDTHKTRENFTYFNITKASLTPSIIAQNVTVKENASFVVTVNDNFKGKVNITVGNAKYYDDDVKSLISISKLPAGSYAANMTFYGDNNFTKKSVLVPFTVSRVTPVINVTIDDVTYPSDAKAIVNISDYANGTVNITIGEKHFTETITNGHVEIDLTGLSGGVKEAIVNFTASANDKYNFNNTQTVKFEVLKAQSSVNITQNGKDVNATVTPGATGSVTFIIDGKKYERDIINGNATLIGKLTNGNNTIVAIYNGDENYTSSMNVTNNTVDHETALVNVTATNVTYGNDSLITVRVPTAQSGYVRIVVNGTDIDVVLELDETGKAKFNATCLDVGRYRVNVTYLGDDIYGIRENFTYFNVTKANLTVSAIPQNVTAAENPSFVINANNMTGKVHITIGGVSYYDGDIDSLITISKLPAGLYTVNVTFYGNDNFNNKSVIVSLNITRVTPIINVTIDDVTYPAAALAKVNITGYANGTVNITVGDKHFVLPITNGHVEIPLAGLSGGVKEAIVNFTASFNDKFNNNVTTTVKFEVIKATSTVSLEQDGKDVIATVTSDATGDVVFYINGKEYTRQIGADGKATVENALTNGINTVIAIYGGDINFTGSKGAENFTVARETADVNVSATNETYGKASEITVRVPTAQSGYVTITVNDTLVNVTVKIQNGEAKFNASGLSVGRYIVNVTYLGDQTYDMAKNHTYFNITKNNNLNVDVIGQNVTVKENASFVVNITDDFKGKVNITIDGVSYYDGDVKSLIEIGELPAGSYTANVTFYGDDNYNNKSAMVDFVVSRVTPHINVTIDDVTYPDKSVAIVNISDYANGTINITVDGKHFNKTVVNGHVEIDLTGLSAGVKDALVNFTTSDDYNSNLTANVKFNIKKANSTVIITQEGQNVIASVTTNATGNVTFYINGKKYTRDVNDEGKAIVENALRNGNNTIVAIYSGDANFTSAFNATNNTVDLKDSSVKVTATNVTYGNASLITVEVPKDQKGYVRVTVNGTDIDVVLEIKDGIATFNATDLNAGLYEVNVTYLGDGTYGIKENSTYLNISKANLTASVIAQDVTVDENASFIITVLNDFNGNVSIEVDGKIYNGTVKTLVEMEKLLKGAKQATVTFYGDNNYNIKVLEPTFTVSAAEPTINVTVTDTTYPNNATATVKVSGGANGTIVIKVADKTYTKEIRNGETTITLDGLDAGLKEANVTFTSSDDYNSNANATYKFLISKAKSHIEINVTPENLHAGDDAVLNITVSCTGKPIVYLDDEIIDDKELENNRIIIDKSKLTVGKHTVVVYYPGDNNYESSSESYTFVVNPLDAKVKVTVEDTPYANPILITVQTPAAQTGFVTITVGGKNYTAKLENGEAKFNVTGLEVDKYTVNVAYHGDENYTVKTNGTTFNVTQINLKPTVIGVNVTDAMNSTFIIVVPDDYDGQVTITVDGETYTGDAASIIQMAKLDVGEKVAHIVFSDDKNYKGTELDVTFNVTKADNLLPVTTVVNSTTVVVTVPENVTGNVTVVLPNGTNRTVVVDNGSAIITLENMTPGENNITVIYTDGNNTVTTNATITVPKYDTIMNATVSEAKAGGNATVTVKVPVNATGNITVTIDGKTYTTDNITGGEAVITIENLTAGDKTLIVEYGGDANYTANYTLANFTVAPGKVDSEIIVVDHGNGTVVVVIGDNATGNVTIKVGDKKFNATVVNGTAIVNMTNVTPGVHEVEVIYSGDENHTDATTDANITAPRYDTQMNVTVGEAKEGEPVVITVEVPVGATGDVIVYVGGENHTAEIDPETGKAIVVVENISAGNHTVAVEYAGDGNYSANYTIANMTVEKAKTESDLTVVDYGNGTVVVVVGDNATGNVTIKVGDNEYTGTVVNGTAIVNVDKETPGVHEAEVIYSGDDTHTNATSDVNITAPRYDTEMNVTVGEAKEGEPVVITVEVPVGATGEIIVYVGGENHTAEIDPETGIATVSVDNVSAGNHTIAVEYAGDNNYAPNYTVSNMTVEKGKATSDITVVDQGNGTVVVVIGDNATGNVTVKIGGETYNATVTNGTAVITLDNVTAGTHEIEVIYSGDDTHTNATANATITVKDPATKKDSPINITVKDISVGDKATVIVTLPEDVSGNVTVEIDGVKYTKEIENGKATFEVENLTAGVKSVFATYSGDDEYASNYTSGQFNVSKVPTDLKVEIKDAKVGENVTITITLPEDATGQILIDIDGVGYYANVSDGVAIAEIPYLPSGTYDVNLTYTGDDKYLSSSNKTAVKVEKIPSFVIPTASNIKVGENEVIKLRVPADATGNVTVVIDGEEYNFDLTNGALGVVYREGEKYTVAISGGNGELTVSGLPKGEYTVSVRYNGDNKYLPSQNSTIFTVSKIDTEMEVVDQGNGTVLVILPENATGTVTVTLDGQNYTADVENGTATITLDGATPGVHDVDVKYSGDNNYSSKTSNATVDIPKYDTPISVSVDDIKVGETAVVVVTLPENATGKVTIEINGVEYTTDAKDGKATFNVDGLAYGNKTVAVTYEGDDNYVENFTTGQFEVAKNPSTTKATSKNINVGKDEVITVTVPGDATGRVLVDIDGVGYYADIVNGKVKVIIPNLEAGKYKATVTYEGDDKYLPSNTEVTFTVSKVKAPVSAAGDEIKQGEDGTVIVKVPADATGTVTIEVNGKTYTQKVENGQAIFSVPGLKVGDYPVSAYYSGDGKYESNDTITDIIVIPAGHDNNDTGKHANAQEGISLADYATGNPIFVLLFVILTVGLTQLRRFRK